MHPCLCVDEILRLLTCELVASGAGATAVSLACCCKIFEDPVLDVLWRTQERLLPLLKSLPGDVWNEDGYKVDVAIMFIHSLLNYSIRKSFRRSPTTSEWTRFRKCTRRMRKLEEYTTLHLPPSQVLSVLQLRASSESLLPNLRSLMLRLTVNFIPFIALFLSPTTTILDLSFDEIDPPEVVAPIVTTFPKLCPNLQSISLHAFPRDPIITAATSELLLTTNRGSLRSFHVDSPLTGEACEVISKLPDLCGLSDWGGHFILPNDASKSHQPYYHLRSWQ